MSRCSNNPPRTSKCFSLSLNVGISLLFTCPPFQKRPTFWYPTLTLYCLEQSHYLGGCLMSLSSDKTASFINRGIMLLAHHQIPTADHILLLLLLSHFSRVRPSATPWPAARQAPPSMGFSRQEHWSGLPFPPPGDPPDPGISLQSPASATLADGFFLMIEPPRKQSCICKREGKEGGPVWGEEMVKYTCRRAK